MTTDSPGSLNRRGLLTAVGGATTALTGLLTTGPAAALTSTASTASAASAADVIRAGPPEPTAFGPVTVRPADTRYQSLLRGDNFRFVGRPDEVRVLGSTGQVVRAVADAVRSGRRPAARSGGHCFEDFTANPSVRMLLDLSPMDAVGYDPGLRAFSVQPGATLGHVYRTLFKGWGVTVPAGGCPGVGAGGHFVGGGYGPLSRRYGSLVDHLHGVEVVVVDRDGSVRAVRATREPDDPNHDLWWAHTGGGGGNFGVVTRYWLRAPDATGADPARLLPAAPRELLECLVGWSWDARMTERVFTTLLRNFGVWHERNSAPDSPYLGLYAILVPAHRSAGGFRMTVQIDAGLPGADRMVTEFVAAVTAGTGVTPSLEGRRTFPWLHPTTWPGSGENGDVVTRRYKEKAGYLRRSFTDGQLAAIYRNLTNRTGGPTGGMLLVGYGGRVGTVPPEATAIAQRDAVMKAVFHTTWADESDDAANLAWIREFYREVYRDTGGVPVPGEVSDGSYINYPDADLADPAWNTSGTPWHTLYYKQNYPRLQRIKAHWDPRGVFRHALAIEPAPGGG
ncbi:FAD-binding oxidoreductase [Streptacidiphilus sp. P02-A3a]|uniref:FAD-binding oxidoreductase n=1 Tax=Streptacidiphilus sp. P02-A3a TaxID=2704468 RepID=UPI0015F78B7C|nr:FAD-binding protein [Streptacidiphilus sp. P02-A3a]QMU71485.1 FAD-binding oxidoreductase [Streptacidiphilus sp. P02-A3a]